MAVQDVDTKALAIVEANLGRSIRADEELLASKLMDSVAVLDIVVELEEMFGVAIPNKDVTPQNFCTVAAMVQYIKNKSAA